MCLARDNRKVILLDKARFPRPKLCGGLLTRKSMALLERLYSLAPAQGLQSGILNYRASGYEVYAGRELLLQNSEGYPFYFVQREVFDAHLLGQAANVGVDVRDGCAVKELVPEQGKVVTVGGDTLRAEWIVAADGSSSLARKSCGLSGKAWKKNLALAMETRLDMKELPNPPARPRVYAGYAGGGYCWSFPNKDRVLVGVCELMRSRTPLKRRFDAFAKDLGLSSAAMPSLQAHALPYGNYLRTPARERVLLVGDAGGMVEPLFGEGMYYAMRSGELAAKALLGSQASAAGREYVSLVRRELLPEFRWSRLLRSVFYYGCKLNALVLIKSLSLDGGRRILDIIHGERSFKLFGLRQRA